MDALTQLWLFSLIVLGVVLLPGLDMACVLASGLAGGPRDGLASVAGIVIGGLGHVVTGTLGIAAVLALSPSAFNAMLLAGAMYMAWIGIGLTRAGLQPELGMPGARKGLEAFRRGALSNMLNPKAYLFMLAVFPQFLRVDHAPVWQQAAVLWLIIALIQIGVYGSVAVAAGRVRNWLAQHPETLQQLFRVVGMLLVLASVYTGWVGWKAL